MKEGTRLKHLFDVIEKTGNKVSNDFLFFPETAIYMSEVDLPCISYRIYDREPDAGRSGYKPQWKKREQNPNKKSSNIVTYSQQFKAIIEFCAWGKTYEETDDERDWFEKFMVRHSGKLREEGMLDIFFVQQHDDQVVEIKDNYFVKQTLHYFVKNERVVENTVGNIEDITTAYDGFSKHQNIKNKLNTSKEE